MGESEFTLNFSYSQDIEVEVSKITQSVGPIITKAPRISKRICEKFHKEVLQKERPLLFTDGFHTGKLVESGSQYFNDEASIVMFDDDIDISNYGRVLVRGKSGFEERHTPGLKLTDEIISYIYAFDQIEKLDLDIICCIIDTYNQNWAYSVNKVHDSKIKEIEEEISKRYEKKYKLDQVEKIKLDSTVKDLMVWKDHYERSIKSLNNRIDILCELIKDGDSAPAKPEEQAKATIEQVKNCKDITPDIEDIDWESMMD